MDITRAISMVERRIEKATTEFHEQGDKIAASLLSRRPLTVDQQEAMVYAQELSQQWQVISVHAARLIKDGHATTLGHAYELALTKRVKSIEEDHLEYEETQSTSATKNANLQRERSAQRRFRRDARNCLEALSEAAPF